MNTFAWPVRSRPVLPDVVPDAAVPPCASTSVGAETVRGITLMLMAACLATVVVVTQRVLQLWVGDDLFLGWTVMWCVVLAAMQWLSRRAQVWSFSGLQRLDAWAQRLAQQRARHRAQAPRT